MSDIDSKYYSEILATGRDYIPEQCPKICDRLPEFRADIVTYGRRVFCRRKRAANCPIKVSEGKGIPISEAIAIDREGIARYDAVIRDILHRKEVLEAEVESLRNFA
jgi:hypothetical protein